MALKLDEAILCYKGPEVKTTIKLVTLLATDKSQLFQLTTELTPSTPSQQQRHAILKTGMFANSDFLNIMNKLNDGKGINMSIAAHLLQRLVEWNVVAEIDLGPHSQFDYQWNDRQARLLLTADAIDNVLLGPASFSHKYAPAVPAILVRKNGSDAIGTGFVTQYANKEFLVTAKHNVDAAAGAIFKSLLPAAETEYEIGSWKLSRDYDLAACAIKVRPTVRYFSLQPVQIILSTTITLGYPKVATTDRPYLLAHRGELNAVVSSYIAKQDYLIISNLVAPGSSRSPVLNEAGLVIGVVTDAFETKDADGTTAMRAAIPAASVAKFLDQLGSA